MEPRTPVWSAPSQLTGERVEAAEREALARLGDDRVLVVDLSAAVFVASSALGMLVKLSMRLHDRGGGLAVAAAPPAVAKMLRMVGLERVLPAFETVDAAARHLAARRPARV
jgi:anti-anti-sigma factor